MIRWVATLLIGVSGLFAGEAWSYDGVAAVDDRGSQHPACLQWLASTPDPEEPFTHVAALAWPAPPAGRHSVPPAPQPCALARACPHPPARAPPAACLR